MMNAREYDGLAEKALHTVPFAQLDIISKLDDECHKRGLEIERQAAEILELENRIAFLEAKINTRESHIAQLIAEKAELQRH